MNELDAGGGIRQSGGAKSAGVPNLRVPTTGRPPPRSPRLIHLRPTTPPPMSVCLSVSLCVLYSLSPSFLRSIPSFIVFCLFFFFSFSLRLNISRCSRSNSLPLISLSSSYSNYPPLTATSLCLPLFIRLCFCPLLLHFPYYISVFFLPFFPSTRMRPNFCLPACLFVSSLTICLPLPLSLPLSIFFSLSVSVCRLYSPHSVCLSVSICLCLS